MFISSSFRLILFNSFSIYLTLITYYFSPLPLFICFSSFTALPTCFLRFKPFLTTCILGFPSPLRFSYPLIYLSVSLYACFLAWFSPSLLSNLVISFFISFSLSLCNKCAASWARILKLLRSPGVDSKESIPPAYVAWLAGTTTLFLLNS